MKSSSFWTLSLLVLVSQGCRLVGAWQLPPTALRSPLHRTSLSSRNAISSPLAAFPELSLPEFIAPIEQAGRSLFHGGIESVPEAATTLVLESIGRDFLLFLAASVIVMPISKRLNVTPILGYLIVGAVLGPHALDIFSNSKADVELGDFGILFLLFSEGLDVSSARLSKLTRYLPLGFAQISLTTAALTAAILLGVPEFLDRFLPLDSGLITIHNPAEAVVLALAGALSTSAFIFPVLKEKEWEEESSGEAATSVLLLQDLVVAPVLVLLPFIVGKDPTDYAAIGFLTAKAIFGFGSVMVAGSVILRRLFKVIAQTGSTETFVALCLLVSVGMGSIAKSLGLTDTAGAFAAGVLLANTNYRAQIQADIAPFKGILLGIFFMDAGSSFDIELVIRELPTILTGAVGLILVKAATLFSATRVPRSVEPNRLELADAVRVSLLLSGGGEFAFVVLALAERLGVIPDDLGSVLTAIVLITMAITPFLGEVAEMASDPFLDKPPEGEFDGLIPTSEQQVSPDAIVVCGYDLVGRQTLEVLSAAAVERDGLPSVVAFDVDPSLVDNVVSPPPGTMAVYGDPSRPMVLRANGIRNPKAIFVTYGNHARVLSTTAMLRSAFPESAIYARAQTRPQAQALQAAGASEVVVESDELPRSARSLLEGIELGTSVDVLDSLDQREVDYLKKLFACIDREESGSIDADGIAAVIRKSNSAIASDEEIDAEESWLRKIVQAPIDFNGFCRLYVRAPRSIKNALGNACLI